MLCFMFIVMSAVKESNPLASASKAADQPMNQPLYSLIWCHQLVTIQRLNFFRVALIHLSYSGIITMTGFEPAPSPFRGDVLPLNYIVNFLLTIIF